MPKVIKTPLPAASQIWRLFQQGDFIDGYAVRSTLSPQEAAHIGLSMPGWANALLGLRNAIVKPLGLKTEAADTGDDAIFPVQYADETEYVIGTDDHHLNFRISLMRFGENIHMATWVHRNNALGRIYLAAVMPFHILIVRNAMRQIAAASAPIASVAPAQ